MIVAAVYVSKDFETHGWTSLSLQSAGQFLFLTLMLTILSEYVGRILERLRDRPFYYVMDELLSSVLLVEKGRYNIVTNSHEAPASSPGQVFESGAVGEGVTTNSNS